MLKNLLGRLRHRPLTKQERLERLQVSLVETIRKGRDEDDATAVALAIQADAILKQPIPFDARCQQLHDVVISHAAQKLLTRLESYHH